jgi:two-component system response regulator PilR (NtrC family)
MESGFFGHEKGAFTGATQRRVGRFALADQGTIFLDEVGELALELQPKLLRVLQEGEFEPVGSSQTRTVDVRVIAATNRRLEEAVRRGQFREDLYYRLSVFPIVVPPLRDRREDIPLLAEHFLAKYTGTMGKTLTGISNDALVLLQEYDWPGNIRELENVIERAVALEQTPTILPESLPEHVAGGVGIDRGEVRLPEAGFDLEQHVRDIERDYLAEALKKAGGVQVRAAELLGMSFRSFRYYAKKYNLR